MLVIQQPAESGAPAANHPAGPARCRMVQPWFRQLRWQAAAGVFWSGASSNGSGRGILHSRHASPAHGDGRSQGCGRALPPHLYRRRLCRNAVAFVRQLDFGAYASVPQHHPEEIWPRGCLRQKSRNSLRQARISGVCATRESRASDFGFRKMGHVQVARTDASAFRVLQSLAGRLIALLENPEHQTEMAIQNFSAALRISMPEIIRQYLRTFHLQRHLGMLTSVSRLRRLPKWLPLRLQLARLASRRLIASLATAPRAQLLNGQSNGRGDLLVSGAPVNGNGKGLAWSVSAGDGLVAVAGAATGDETECNQGQDQQPSDSPDYLSRAPSSGNGNGHTHNAEAGQPKSVSQWAPASLPPSILHRGNRRGNGEFGTDDLSSGGNGTGHKGAAHADGQPGAGKRDGARERAGDGSDGDLRAG